MTKSLHCKQCCTSRTGDVLGAPCRTEGCDGIIEEVPDFRTLVDELPEPMTCGRRDRGEPNSDRWLKFKSNGNRVCSYCGSLHPEDLFALAKMTIDAPEDATYRSVPEIEVTDKNYKLYVHQPGVRNAHEGGIKFYTPHFVGNVTPEQSALLCAAVEATQKRFNVYMKSLRL